MNTVYIIANWKSNKTTSEALMWLGKMQEVLSQTQKTVILLPPVTALASLSEGIKQKNIPLILGAQDISPFGSGAYTGEVHGGQIKEYSRYVLIGHSERRMFFHEDNDLLAKKVTMAKEQELIPIFCVQDMDTLIPNGVEMVAYEPPWAIGTGNAQSPSYANEVAHALKQQKNIKTVMYGGSVNAENVATFTQMQYIDGVLVGSASLDPQAFSQIINA